MKKKPLAELLEFGIVNLDKSAGPTSFQVAEMVGRILGVKKFSHFGTLDPKVTGVLPVALSRACKLTGYFISHDKEYIGIARFHDEVSIEELEKKIKEKFLGEIIQMPPVKSRVKRQERPRTIYYFNILEKKEKDFLFRVKCQGGTYIRKLIDDLGRELGIGAHMLELRRVSAGIFSEEDKEFVNLYDLEKMGEEELRKIIIPAEEAIKKILPTLAVGERRLAEFLTGKPILRSDLEDDVPEGKVAVFCGERFVGIYRKVDEGNIVLRAEWVRN